MDMMSNNKLYMIIISDFKIQREALVLKKLCKIEVVIGKTFRIRLLKIIYINHRAHFSHKLP